ncbi:MAG: NADP-dependent phosphogluconate dehydrogenase [Candidatus Saccharimonadales bacterium]
MKVGFIGLGKMGGNMTTRLLNDQHEVVVFDPNKEAVQAAADRGANAADSLEDLVAKTETAIFWLMIPSDYVDKELDALLKLVAPESIIIDGGNSDFRLSQQRAEKAKQHNVHFVDIGTSGGVLGIEQGYAMMIGGDTEAVEKITPLVESLAPKDGWYHFGKPGSGHYVKMVHNAIEYGIMESYAEGYRMLREGPIADIDLAAAGKVWQNGSIIESLLNDLTKEALEENPTLEGIEGFVKESGETRWALEVAKEHNLDTPAIQAAFDVRLESQKGKTNFATKLLAAMRNKFGGHAINKEK